MVSKGNVAQAMKEKFCSGCNLSKDISNFYIYNKTKNFIACAKTVSIKKKNVYIVIKR